MDWRGIARSRELRETDEITAGDWWLPRNNSPPDLDSGPTLIAALSPLPGRACLHCLACFRGQKSQTASFCFKTCALSTIDNYAKHSTSISLEVLQLCALAAPPVSDRVLNSPRHSRRPFTHRYVRSRDCVREKLQRAVSLPFLPPNHRSISFLLNTHVLPTRTTRTLASVIHHAPVPPSHQPSLPPRLLM